MEQYKLFRRILITWLTACAVSGSAAVASQTWPSLTMADQTYPSVCEQATLTGLRQALKGFDETEELFRMAELILCGPLDASSKKQVRKIMGKSLREGSWGPLGTQEIRQVMSSDELVEYVMASGSAWNADVQNMDEGPTVNYFSNEACVKSFTLKRVRSRWVLYQIGEACD
jgi:hypothetical protein